MPAKIAGQLKSDIDKYCAEHYNDGHRWHLGASLIGKKCPRLLWFIFRWCFLEKHDGRQQRLFNRGHLEEKRFIEWLTAIGCKVYDLDQNGKQYRISACQGHFGGSLDAIVILPPAYEIDEPVLGEFKTNNTGPGFAKLLMSGVAVEKEQHYSQMCVYGSDPAYNFNYAAYLNICKNDDNLHIEIVKLDHKHGNDLRIKAENIIASHTPPPKLSENQNHTECNCCPAKDICHNGKPYEKNCRSCESAFPIKNSEWYCQKHNGVIPRDYVGIGCPQYQSIGKQL